MVGHRDGRNGRRIAWQEWGEAAFARARAEDRPILLAIGAVWCHWCHVMDETTYSDPEVIDLVNAEFVPIVVDNDRRPDVNRRYNMGGWPTTAILTPDGDVLTGGTYIPPDAMKDLLRRVLSVYRTRREDIVRAAREAAGQRAAEAAQVEPGPLSPDIVEDVLGACQRRFDPRFGGFRLGGETKFPQVEALGLLLDQDTRQDVELYRFMVEKSLDAMAGGGMFDHEAGGFFRYSTNRDWSVPHFEKMLEDNAGLLEVYCRAYRRTGEARYRGTAGRVVDYLQATLTDAENGGFYGSQDADEEYYARPLAERLALEAPVVDTTLYADWNAQAARAYFIAARVLQRPELAAFAARTLDRIWDLCWDAERGLHHYWDGRPALPGLLGDAAWMVRALVEGLQETGRRDWLERAETLARRMIERLWDANAGAFFDTEAPGPAALARRHRPLDENAVAARALVALAEATGDEGYRERARKVCEAFARDYQRWDMMAAGYARAVDVVLHPPLRAVTVGRAGDPTADALHAAALALDAPARVAVRLADGEDGARLARFGLGAAGEAGSGGEAAPGEGAAGPARTYLCAGTACAEPVTDPARLAEAASRLLETAGRPAGMPGPDR